MKNKTIKPKKKTKKYRYYLVSFMFTTDHSGFDRSGFGNIFFKASPYLDIRKAEKEIKQINAYKHTTIIAINKITKWQHSKSNKI